MVTACSRQVHGRPAEGPSIQSRTLGANRSCVVCFLAGYLLEVFEFLSSVSMSSSGNANAPVNASNNCDMRSTTVCAAGRGYGTFA